jgi:SAM-dependent methyltransferase
VQPSPVLRAEERAANAPAMKTTLIPERLLEVLKRHRRAYQSARAARLWLGGLIPPRRLSGLDGRVHFNDFMLADSSPAGVDAYRKSAMSVLANIEDSLTAAGRWFDDIGSWLDFGCGYGRVIRFLVERVDPKRVYAADVIEQAVEFCAAEFGVNPIYSQDALANLDDLGSFDFFYAISVLTHLNEKNSIELLRLTHDVLKPGGIAMFTTHGQASLDRLESYGAIYDRGRGAIKQVVAREGIAFVPYHHYSGDCQGMTWQSGRWIEEQMQELHGDSMNLMLFNPHALYGHQDVFAYERTP